MNRCRGDGISLSEMLHGRTVGIWFAFGCLVCSVALAQSIRTSHRPGIDFSKYKTYKWVTVKGGQHSDPSLDAQIKQAIDSQLAKKGLTKTEDGGDLNIEYQLAISNAQVWRTYEDWTLVGPAARLPQRKEVTIDVGTLVLDMYDPADKQLVWTGRAHKALDPKSTEADKKEALDSAVKKLLLDYPPK